MVQEPLIASGGRGGTKVAVDLFVSAMMAERSCLREPMASSKSQIQQPGRWNGR